MQAQDLEKPGNRACAAATRLNLAVACLAPPKSCAWVLLSSGAHRGRRPSLRRPRPVSTSTPDHAGPTSTRRTTPILAPNHPLANVFSVGPDGRRDLRRAAADVVGFAIGDRVRCCFRRYDGRLATVVRINPADCEVGVTVSDADRILWCVPSELSRAGDKPYKAPRSRATA